MNLQEQEPGWLDEQLDNPHAVDDKARRVRAMFAAIAHRYDLNNRVHSLGRDQAWRRRAVALCKVTPADVVLDVACGTGDLALAFATGAGRVIGVDFTHEMLRIAQQKQLADASCPVHYLDGDAMRLPIADASVHVVSIAFGIRNVAAPVRAMDEFYRVLKPGGRLCILEFSQPRNRVLRSAYRFYFQHVMPRTAALIARDRSGAYRYLPRSVDTFLDRDQLMTMMRDAGFTEVRAHPLTFGIAVAYLGRRA